ncbi:Uncharacterised protein [Mycobacteroides abscessus subsp. abscessus]|nr:Uncharacterised protein [Mycobacteroides abscessus subsp. abscessus]
MPSGSGSPDATPSVNRSLPRRGGGADAASVVKSAGTVAIPAATPAQVRKRRRVVPACRVLSRSIRRSASDGRGEMFGMPPPDQERMDVVQPAVGLAVMGW